MNRTIAQYENKLAVNRSEIERLEESIRGVKGEREQLKGVVQQLQDELARTGSRLPEYEQRMKQLLGEI